MSIKSLFLKVFYILTLFCQSGFAIAQAGYPSRPIRVIVPLAPGGTTDILARLVSQRLDESLGVRVIVDNRPGAAGNIGTQLAAKAQADGHTLMMGFDGTLVINPAVYREIPFNTLQDFAPITKVADLPLIAVANPGVPANTLKELVSFAKSKPGNVTYSSAGHGSTGHLTGELLSQRLGIQMTHVPYKGGGQALIDVLGGQVQLLFVAIPTVQPHVKAGKLKPLLVTSLTRSAAVPQVPTAEESGVRGFSVSSWVGLFTPASTPKEVVTKLYQGVLKITQAPETRDRMLELGAEPRGTSPAQFAKEIREEIAIWAKVVTEAKIQQQ